jgi:hypothetical protein
LDVAAEDLADEERVWSMLQAGFKPVMLTGRRIAARARHPRPGNLKRRWNRIGSGGG